MLIALATHYIELYVMCGFANFGRLGIMIGGLSIMVPQQHREIVQLSLRSILAGTLATMMAGCVVSIVF